MSKRPAKKPASKVPAGKTAKEDVAPAASPPAKVLAYANLGKKVKEDITPAVPAPKPLKPRPKLFWILLVIFLIWLGGLLALYFKKVYPMRYPSSAPVAGAKS